MGDLDVRIRHGGGGGGGNTLLTIALVILGAAVLAGPVATAAVTLVHVVVLAVAAVVVLAVVVGAAVLAWRLRRGARPRALPWTPRAVSRSAAPGTVHLHFHGVDPAEVPGIVDAARAISSPRPSWPDPARVADPEGVARDGR